MRNQNIAAIVLAAGGGTRIGGKKMLLPWKGIPILGHTISIVNKLTDISYKLCVLGHERALVYSNINHSSFAPADWIFIENPNWQKGQSTSVQTAVKQIMQATSTHPVDGIIIFLGDQPTVKPQTAQHLMYTFTETRKKHPNILAAAPYFQNQRGNPVVFSKELFPELLVIKGDKGAREILVKLQEQLLQVPVDDPGVIFDVDTQEEYEKLLTHV